MTFDEILALCIEEIEQGRSVEQCLQRFPKQAADLAPMLHLVEQMHTVTPQQLSKEAFQRGRQQLAEHARRLQGSEQHTTHRPSVFVQPANSVHRRPPAVTQIERRTTRRRTFHPARWTNVLVICSLFLGLYSFGWNVNSSLPGQLFYSLKRQSEGMQEMFMTFSGRRSEWLIEKADRRLDELLQLEHYQYQIDPALVSEAQESVQIALANSATLSQAERQQLYSTWLGEMQTLRRGKATDGLAIDVLEQSIAQIQQAASVETALADNTPTPFFTNTATETIAPSHTAPATDTQAPSETPTVADTDTAVPTLLPTAPALQPTRPPEVQPAPISETATNTTAPTQPPPPTDPPPVEIPPTSTTVSEPAQPAPTDTLPPPPPTATALPPTPTLPLLPTATQSQPISITEGQDPSLSLTTTLPISTTPEVTVTETATLTPTEVLKTPEATATPLVETPQPTATVDPAATPTTQPSETATPQPTLPATATETRPPPPDFRLTPTLVVQPTATPGGPTNTATPVLINPPQAESTATMEAVPAPDGN